MENKMLKSVMDEKGHVSFSELADYIFSDGRSEDFFANAARINKHVMECPMCYKVYHLLMVLRKKTEALANEETAYEGIRTKIFSLLSDKNSGKSIEKLMEECFGFKLWLTFRVRNMMELLQVNDSNFIHPQLVTIMLSASDKDAAEETVNEVRSSLFDKNKNRVSIGLDGTLSLYFDATEYPVGKRIVIVPDNESANPQMFELTRYDNDLSYVRIDEITPGQYTIMTEK